MIIYAKPNPIVHIFREKNPWTNIWATQSEHKNLLLIRLCIIINPMPSLRLSSHNTRTTKMLSIQFEPGIQQTHEAHKWLAFFALLCCRTWESNQMRCDVVRISLSIWLQVRLSVGACAIEPDVLHSAHTMQFLSLSRIAARDLSSVKRKRYSHALRMPYRSFANGATTCKCKSEKRVVCSARSSLSLNQVAHLNQLIGNVMRV